MKMDKQYRRSKQALVNKQNLDKHYNKRSQSVQKHAAGRDALKDYISDEILIPKDEKKKRKKRKKRSKKLT